MSLSVCLCLSVCVFLQVFLPPTYASLLFLVGDAILYGLLAWYLDGVIRGNQLHNQTCDFSMLYLYSQATMECQENCEYSYNYYAHFLLYFMRKRLRGRSWDPIFHLFIFLHVSCSHFPFQLSYWLPTKGKSPPSGQQRSVLQDTDNDQDTSDEDDAPLLTKGYVRSFL